MRMFTRVYHPTEGEIQFKHGDADEPPAHQEQVAALVERWGVKWQR